MDLKKRVERKSEADELHFSNITDNEGVELIKVICEHEIYNKLIAPTKDQSEQEVLGELRAYRKIIADIEAFQTRKDDILRARRERRKEEKEEIDVSEEPQPHTGEEGV